MTATETSAAEVQQEAEHERAELANTLDQLRENLRPANMVDEVMASAKITTQDITERAWRTARNHPIPAALIGIGVAMILGVGQTVRSRATARDTDSTDEDRSPNRPVARSRLDAPPAARHGLPTGRQIGRAADAASARASAAMSQIAESTRVLRDRASRTANGSAFNSRASFGAARKDNVMPQYSQSRDGLTNKLSNLLDEQPLVLAALGIAVGAAIGAAIPSTDTEGRWMGEASGSVKRSAQELAQDQYAQLKAKAGETLEDIKQTAADHGVSSENLTGLVQDVGGRVRDAAHEVADGALKTNQRPADA